MIGANLARIRAELSRRPRPLAAPPPRSVEVLAATKYVAGADMPALARAGVRLVGENRAQDLQAKVAAHGELFEWDFIGAAAEPPRAHDRSARAPDPLGRLAVGAAASSSATATSRGPGLRILLEVNVAGESGKAGVAPEQLDAFIARAPVPVAGLMTMPPLAGEPEQSRALVRRAARAGRRARPGAPLDGHLAGLRRGRRGGRHDRADRHQLCMIRPRPTPARGAAGDPRATASD